jgi:hypothetical protein
MLAYELGSQALIPFCVDFKICKTVVLDFLDRRTRDKIIELTI